MKRRTFIRTSLAGTVISCLSPAVFADNKLPNILIIGDSISMGYTPFVQELMKGKANVSRPKAANGGRLNCEGTTKGVKMIDEWLTVDKWDIIHFNFGLHDLKHVDAKTGKNSTNPDDPQQTDLKTYKRNLDEIVKKLVASGAKLIFATTTPYPDFPSGPLRRANQVEKYNKVALKIMKRYDVEVNNLHDFVLPQMKALQKPNNVHFTKEGSVALAKQVAKYLEELL